MGKPRPWTLLDTERVQDCTVFRVHRDRLRAPWGEPAHPYWRIEADDWVNVVAVTAEAQVVMVRQWRHGTREITLEIPGGIVDPGESPAAAAARELLEESGYGGGTLVPIGALSPNPALFTNRVSTLLGPRRAPRRRDRQPRRRGDRGRARAARRSRSPRACGRHLACARRRSAALVPPRTGEQMTESEGPP